MIGLISLGSALLSMFATGVDDTISPITIGKSAIETGLCKVVDKGSTLCLIGVDVDWAAFDFSDLVGVSFVRFNLGRPTKKNKQRRLSFMRIVKIWVYRRIPFRGGPLSTLPSLILRFLSFFVLCVPVARLCK